MAHTHSHHHHEHHAPQPGKLTGAFIAGIALNALFVLTEVIAGLYIHSLSLLADAGHNLADVGALALSLIAYRLLTSRPTKNYTYGFRKTSVLVALFNAMVLLVSVGAILFEAAHRFLHPEALPGQIIALVAGAGIIINTVSALFFMRDREKDLNVKSAYMHLMADAVVSLALVAGGIIIYYTRLYWIDSALSVAVAAVILVTTWRLVKSSVRLSLDGVPADIEIDDIQKIAMQVKGVKGLHHIHVWALSTTETALTAHLVLADTTTPEEAVTIKDTLRHELQHNNIHHITLETERESEVCRKEEC